MRGIGLVTTTASFWPRYGLPLSSGASRLFLFVDISIGKTEDINEESIAYIFCEKCLSIINSFRAVIFAQLLSCKPHRPHG